jgi:nitrate/nitrite transport system ATP-binding protein
MNAPIPVLELSNVGKSFPGRGGAREILRDVNLSVASGEFVCVVGYSGAGKTTLINMIAGLTKPDAGRILINGQPVLGPSLDNSLVFQNYSLLPWLTALGNVELAVRQCKPTATKTEIREISMHYLGKVKLGHAMDRRPAELSGGMRQRVCLARGLAMKPKLFLLDEPLGALDALTRSELQDELTRIQEEEKPTMLMITNDVDEAIMLADRIVPLSAGPAATSGPPTVVTVARPRNRKQLNFDPHYHHDRKVVLHYLLTHGPSDVRQASAASSSLYQTASSTLETVTA